MPDQAKTKVTKSATMPPQRGSTHQIDTDAVRLVRTRLTSDWVERSVEDRDYGIDMMIEAFDDRSPTGILILLQIKGHEGSFGSDEVSLSVPVKTLLYARMFQAPFFLLHASLADNRVHFVWLQKYINTRLAIDSPRWLKQDHVKIYFPKDNVLNGTGLSKIRSLVAYVVHRDLGMEFLRHLIWLRQHVEEFHHGGGSSSLEQALGRLKEIAKLTPFFAAYEDECPELDLAKMRVVLDKARSYGQFDYDHGEFVDEQLTHLHEIELMFLSKDETDAFVAESLDSDLPY